MPANITTADLVLLAKDIYLPPVAYPWDSYWTKDAVVAGHKILNGVHCISLRGSAKAIDWIRNFEALPEYTPDLGYVYTGFFDGMRDTAQEVMSMLAAEKISEVCITGHSLGGARARILAALLLLEGITVLRLSVFGSPKPGYAKLASIVAGCKIHESFRNGHDVVPLLSDIGDDWVHTEPWTVINVQPTAGIPLEIFEAVEDHGISLYYQGLRG